MERGWLGTRGGRITAVSFGFLLVALAVLALMGLAGALGFLLMLAGALLGAGLAYLLTAFFSRWGRLVAFVLVLLWVMLPFFELLVLYPRGYDPLLSVGTSPGFYGFRSGFFIVAVLGLLSPSSLRPRGERSENADGR